MPAVRFVPRTPVGSRRRLPLARAVLGLLTTARCLPARLVAVVTLSARGDQDTGTTSSTPTGRQRELVPVVTDRVLVDRPRPVLGTRGHPPLADGDGVG